MSDQLLFLQAHPLRNLILSFLSARVRWRIFAFPVLRNNSFKDGTDIFVRLCFERLFTTGTTEIKQFTVMFRSSAWFVHVDRHPANRVYCGSEGRTFSGSLVVLPVSRA